MVNEDIIICLLDMFSIICYYRFIFVMTLMPRRGRRSSIFTMRLSTQGKNGMKGRQGHLEHEEEKTERN